MNRIFLGPLLHWLVIVAIAALGWTAGQQRLHVTSFNLFVTVLAVLSALAVVVTILTSHKDRRLTRDPLEDDPGE